MENMNGRYERRNPFSVPEGYFDTLEDKIMERVAELNKSASGKLMAFIRPYIGMAATFLVTLFVLHLIVSYVDGDASSTMQETVIRTVASTM